MSSHLSPSAQTLLTRRDNLAELCWRDGLPDGSPTPTADSLPGGAVLLRVEAVALTANTLTYGLLGEQLRYWDFFPSSQPGWGCLPAWGTAQVEASTVSELPQGCRVSGLLPIATHCVMRPVRVTPRSLRDGAVHRRDLPGAYQHYDRLAPTEAGAPGPDTTEALGALLRPLFVLGFLLADYIVEMVERPSSATVVLTSASSKTAQAIAEQLAGSGIRVVGLTGPAHLGACAASGLYDAVLGYPSVVGVAEHTVDGGVVLVDIAGDPLLRDRLRAALEGRVARTVLVGAAHRAPGPVLVPSSTEEVFFAPDRIRRRTADWGADELRRRQDLAWQVYLAHTRPRVTLLPARGPEALTRVYHEVRQGHCPPEHGHILFPAAC